MSSSLPREELSRQAAVVGRQRSQLEEQALGLREMEREVRDLSAQLARWQASIPHSRYCTTRYCTYVYCLRIVEMSI